jgi:hypothetical protein
VPARDGKIKAPTTVGRMWLVGLGILGFGIIGLAGVCLKNLRFQSANRHRTPLNVISSP